MTLEEAKVELEKFVKLKTSMRPAFVQPLLDAKEVKHGHWKRTDILFCRQNSVRCSCCGHLTPTYGKVLDSFCRFCGAEMDEVLNVPLRNGKSMMELERLMDEVEDV